MSPMKYNFDEMIDRRGSGSYKWDGIDRKDILPMWVADMDFRAADPIMDALRKRVEHGVFGYTRVPDAYYQAVIDWFRRRHGLEMKKEWITYVPGVVPAISAIIKAFTCPGDKVLIQTPVYNCFFSSIRNNGCGSAENTLILENAAEDNTGHGPAEAGAPAHTGRYVIDFDDLEREAADPAVKLMLLCNPHNPAGRVWTREELTRIGEICLRNNVMVVADEIHCELVFGGHKYIPFASISEEFQHNCVTCISPSKAFNIAGLQIANIVASDPEKKAKIDKAVNINEVCDVNPFGVNALIAAYNEGEEWLEQLLEYISGNWQYMKEFCAKKLPDFPLVELEGTYLAWMDCRKLAIPSMQLEEDLIEKTGLWLNAGSMYGEDGEGFMRWNLACPRARVIDGLGRFLKYISAAGK